MTTKEKNLLWDQCDSTSPVPSAKRFPFSLDPNHIYKSRHPVPGGAYRDRHGRRERDAVDAAALGARRDGRAGSLIWPVSDRTSPWLKTVSAPPTPCWPG